jgi:hypothetical protein
VIGIFPAGPARPDKQGILFGLYYYWVVLARPYPVVRQWDELLLADVQTGKSWEPAFRAATGTLQLPWRS